MKTWLLLTFILCSALSEAQENRSTSRIDSLRSAINKTSEVPEKVSLLRQLSAEYPPSQYQKSLSILETVLQISSERNYVKGMIDAYTGMGAIHRTRSDYFKAIGLYRKAIALGSEKNLALLGETYLEISIAFLRVSKYDSAYTFLQKALNANGRKDLKLEAAVYNMLGNVMKEKNDYKEAIQFYLKATEIFEHTNDDSGLTQAISNVGNVEYLLRNYDKAMKYAEESLRIAEKINQQSSIAYSNRLIGRIYRKQNKLEEAADSYLKAIAIYHRLGARRDESETYFNLGNIYFDKENIPEAIVQYNYALRLQKAIPDSFNLAWSYSAIAQGNYELKKYDRTHLYFDSARTIAEKIGLANVMLDVYDYKALIYAEQKKFKLAYESHVLYANLKDSLTVNQNRLEAQELEEKYQNEKKEQEIKALNASNEIAALQLQKHQAQRNYLIAFTLFTLVLIFVLYNRYKIKVQASRKLEELDRMKTRFFTNLSHEFRTPLSLIIGPLQSRIENCHDAKERSEMEMMIRNAKRLHLLINQLLDISKLESGAMKLQVSPGNLEADLKIMGASFSSLAEYKNIDYTIEVRKTSDVSHYDRDKLEKIVLNLLSNAFKFTDSGGSVLFSAQISKQLVLQVKDTGIGIEEKDMERIFDRFYQAEVDSLSSSEGTGIGLALSKELAILHHGTLSVNSAKGAGSTFELVIPLDRESYAKSEIADSSELLKEAAYLPAPGKSLATETPGEFHDLPVILIAEDNPDMSAFLASILQIDFKVVVAGNGEEGLEKANKTIPDLIVSDVMMPKLDGVHFCRKVKESITTSHVPVIMLTAKADLESKLEGLEVGADDYLSKPFDARELLARIHNLLEQRKRLQHYYQKQLALPALSIDVRSPDGIFIKNMTEVIHAKYPDSLFGVDQLADALSMSRMQLHRKLKALTDKSPGEYLREFRLEKAKELLLVKGLQVSEVAYQTGFNNLSNFTKTFKEYVGITPSEYQSASIKTEIRL